MPALTHQQARASAPGAGRRTVRLQHCEWGAYLVAHTITRSARASRATWFELGANTTRGDLTLQGNAYIGKGMAHHIAQIVQFGNFKGWGAWLQAGYALNTKWSVWGFYGTDRPDSTQLASLPLAG